MLDLLQQSRAAGARQVLGGDPQDLVLPPHVFVDVRNEMPIAKNETFGPIAPIIQVHGEAEALRIANDTEYGLSSAVFTRDQARGLRFALGVEAGMTHINDSSVDDSPTGPFGGEKNSGIGRFGGDWVLQEFHYRPLGYRAAHETAVSILSRVSARRLNSPACELFPTPRRNTSKQAIIIC